jgi:hypothetical protein
LVVLREIPSKWAGTYNALWLCKCDCNDGPEDVTGYTMATTGALRGEHQTRCETCAKDVQRATGIGVGGHNRTHGNSRSPEYQSFHHARNRCNVPTTKGYENYGGRGIRFLFASFEEFYEHVGPRPEGTTLDRIDVNGHYTVGNVRWATPPQQNANKRRRDD